LWAVSRYIAINHFLRGKDNWDKAGIIANVITALFGFGAIFIAARSLKSSNDSLGLTQKSISENVKQFAAINQPFIEVGDFEIIPPSNGNPIQLTYVFRNITSVPVQLISYKSSFGFGDRDPYINEVENDLGNEIDENRYMSKESPYKNKTLLKNDTATLNFSEVLNGHKHLYFSRKVKYKNLITGENRIFFFISKLKPVKGHSDIFPNGTSHDLIYNNNYPDTIQHN